MRKIASVVGCLMVAAACTGGGTQYTVNEAVSKPGVIKVTAKELNDKIKRKKFDMLVQFENLSNKSQVVFLGEMQCFKGENRGALNHAFFGAGERTIDLKPGQFKEFRFVCTFSQAVPNGDFTLVIGRVFSNPNEDGKTTGEELVKGLRIKIANNGRS
jgi:hypothetical protein